MPLYTVGQRKGLGLAAGKPLYVVALDSETNTVIVGDNNDVYADELIANDLNFIAIDSLNNPMMPGLDWGAYPKSRVFTVGIDLQF